MARLTLSLPDDVYAQLDSFARRRGLSKEAVVREIVEAIANGRSADEYLRDLVPLNQGCRPVGHAGSWFARWKGESIPCIHQHLIAGSLYSDPGVNEHRAWPRFIRELKRQRRAIVTTSHPPGPNGIRRRKSYLGLWEIGEPEEADGTLMFPLERQLVAFEA